MQQALECDEGLVDAVASICWASARVQVPEMKRVAEVLKVRFGDEFYQKALDNAKVEGMAEGEGEGMVNPRLVQQLSVRPPDSNLVQQYIEAISAAYSVSAVAEAVNEGEKSKLDDLMKRLENLKRK